MSLPPQEFLADVYRHLPFMVIHTTTDGTVLHCNPETLRVTGYEESELLGKNLWTLLFPGKLFAQVPKFISLIHPTAVLKEVPMTIRTRQGNERIIAFSRHIHGTLSADASDSAPRSFLCMGVDLTDRLQDADRASLPHSAGDGTHDQETPGFGPHIGNAGTVDSEIVTPIAITPRSLRPLGEPPVPGHCPLEQVRDGLARIEMHMSCVQSLFADAELNGLGVLTAVVKNQVAGTLQWFAPLHAAWAKSHGAALGKIRFHVDDLLTLYRPDSL